MTDIPDDWILIEAAKRSEYGVDNVTLMYKAGGAFRALCDMIAKHEQKPVRVPEGQTPLDRGLTHRLLDVIKEGEKARDTGASSPYHGHSLEHCLHATGWVRRDLKIALDKERVKHEQKPVDRKLLCAREARALTDKNKAYQYRTGERDDYGDVQACIRAIELWEEGFGK